MVVATLIASSSAHAFSLGGIASQSALGQPLRLTIPVAASRGEGLRPDCFRVVPTAGTHDEMPPIVTARVSLEQRAAGGLLVVTSPTPVNEPVARVTVEASCGADVRREYVVLLDPPAAETSTMSASTDSDEPGQERIPPRVASAKRTAQHPVNARHAAPGAIAATAQSERRPLPEAVAIIAPVRVEPAPASAGIASVGFISVASAADAPASIPPLDLPDNTSKNNASPQIATGWLPAWPYVAAIGGIVAIALSVVFLRRRERTQVRPSWHGGERGASTQSRSQSITRLGAAPVSFAHFGVTAAPVTKPPRTDQTRPSAAPTEQATLDVSGLDTLLDAVDADQIEERAVRQAWATAREELDGNSVLAAIAGAERELALDDDATRDGDYDHAFDHDVRTSSLQR
jgi:hypothetical protein